MSIELQSPSQYYDIYNTFAQIYTRNILSLQTFVSYLWGNTNLKTALNPLATDPMEVIISCKMFPFSIGSHDTTHISTSAELIRLGNVDSTVSAYKVLGGYNNIFDMGSYTFTPHFNNFLDRAPYTHITIYLPYIGFRQLNVNEIFRNTETTGAMTLYIQYIVDLITGQCNAVLSYQGDNQEKTIFQIENGIIGIDVPLTASNMTNVVRNVSMTALSNAVPLASSMVAGGGITYAAALANNVYGQVSQSHIQKSGVGGTMNNFDMPQYCYLIIERPNVVYSDDSTQGKPCYSTVELCDVNGYTEVESVSINNMLTATETEKNEVETLLKQGVIL